jgi:quinoprotein dehydrogenase-associated probable ABC transporter substrate-binding protein
LRPLHHHRSLILLCAAAFLAVASAAETDKSDVLRVCADPNNLPLSNSKGEGYENKIAEALARDLGRKKVEYTFFPQRMGFVRNTLKLQDPVTRQFKCDLIVGVPARYEMTATTKPYMRSTYALVFRSRPELEQLKYADDLMKLPKEKLRSMRIGVFSNSPGTDWLIRNELLDRAAVFQHQSGDPEESPALTMERELTAGRIDLAIVWGPVAAQLVRRHSGYPAWQAVPFRPDPAIKFDYEIAMGVRHGEKEWKAAIDAWIAGHKKDIDEILTSFGVPLVDGEGNVSARFRPDDDLRSSSVEKRIPLELEKQ